MAVTLADEYRDEARKHVDQAVKLLVKIVFEECSGWDDYNERYQLDLLQSVQSLKEIHLRL